MAHFQKIQVSPSIEVDDNGLKAVQHISNGELILSIQQKDTICFSTIPIFFRNATSAL
jgi:hypothetical protein